MIMPPEELEVIQSNKLKKLYTIAHKIAQESGMIQVRRLEGVEDESVDSALIRNACYIAKLASGARTVDTMSIRFWKHRDYANPELYAALKMTTLPRQSADDLSSRDKGRLALVDDVEAPGPSSSSRLDPLNNPPVV